MGHIMKRTLDDVVGIYSIVLCVTSKPVGLVGNIIYVRAELDTQINVDTRASCCKLIIAQQRHRQ
jgi:hypothetical protein